jgi:hypothetical protein
MHLLIDTGGGDEALAHTHPVPLDDDCIATARDLGICLGDR